MSAESAAPLVNGPNILTTLRLVAVPVFAWMLLAHGDDATWRIWTTVVFVLAILTDLVDGWWARRSNLVTNFGKIADPIADKALTGVAFVGLSILGPLPWIVTIVILVREWGITLLRFVLLRRGIVLAASKGGKLKTALQSVALVLFLIPMDMGNAWGLSLVDTLYFGLKWLVMGLATIVTVVTGIDYVRGAFGKKPEAA